MLRIEGKCWGSGQWRSGLMGVPSPQTHSARYCFFGGRTHPVATLPPPVSSCAVPCCPQPCSPCARPSGPQCTSRACFLPPRFHHLLLFEPSVALGLWFAWQRYSPSPCPFPAVFTVPITSIDSRPRLGWPPMGCTMFYFGPGPAGGNTNLPDTSIPSRSIDPPAPTHDNSPSW